MILPHWGGAGGGGGEGEKGKEKVLLRFRCFYFLIQHDTWVENKNICGVEPPITKAAAIRHVFTAIYLKSA